MQQQQNAELEQAFREHMAQFAPIVIEEFEATTAGSVDEVIALRVEMQEISIKAHVVQTAQSGNISFVQKLLKRLKELLK